MVLEDPSTAIDPKHYAGFWKRFFAACIDMAIYAPLYFFITHMSSQPYQWWGEGIFMVIALLTYALFFASSWQGSPGMHLLGFRVCDTAGARISFSRALNWGVTGTVGWAFCFAGIFYLQSRFDIFAVRDLMQSCQEQNLAADDCAREIESFIHIPLISFVELVYASLGMAVFLLFIWALSIALPKDKTGFHNLICGTRFVNKV